MYGGAIRSYTGTGEEAVWHRPDGFRAYFVNGWPVLIQQWRKAVLVSQSLVVGSTGIDAATSPAELGLLQFLPAAELEALYGRAMEGEERVRITRALPPGQQTVMLQPAPSGVATPAAALQIAAAVFVFGYVLGYRALVRFNIPAWLVIRARPSPASPARADADQAVSSRGGGGCEGRVV